MNQQDFRFNELKNELYEDRIYVSEKWTANFGKLSQYADFEAYNSCIREAFNMVDYVMGNTLYRFRTKTTPLEVVTLKGKGKNGRELKGYIYQGIDEVINYSEAYNFFGKAMLLRKLGFPIPEGLEQVRELRNFTIHNTMTIVGKVSDQLLSYEQVIETLRILGETLHVLGLLRKQDILPEYETMRVKPGDVIGRSKEYRVDSFVAEGGMSRVYSGMHTRLDRRVAIKEMKPYTYSPEQIRNEKQFLVQLEHPEIPQIYDIFDQNGTYYIVMDYIDGVGLGRYVEEKDPDMEERLAISIQICRVLRYIHQDCGMIYADLKPDNIMIDQSGRVFIIDFGISQLAGSNVEADAYSWFYSSPEQMHGYAMDQRTDIYSMGSLLQFLFYYNGEDGVIHCTDQLGDYREEMENLCNICKQQDPNDRFQAISEVEVHLRRIMKEMKEQPKQKKKRRRLYISLSIVGILLLTALGILYYFNGVYPPGDIYMMGKETIESTPRGVRICFSLINRGDDIRVNDVLPWNMLLEIKTKDGSIYHVVVPLKLEEGLESGEILEDQVYIVPWEEIVYDGKQVISDASEVERIGGGVDRKDPNDLE